MGPFVIAWILGEGIIAYRTISRDHLPPSPGRMLASSGLFAVLAVVAKLGPPQARFAALMAFGFDIAAILQVPLTNAGATGKGTAMFPPAGSAGNLQIFPDGGASGAATGTMDTTGGGGGGAGGGGSTGGAGAGGTAAQNQAIAKQVIQANPKFSGWDSGSQWDCLVKLWTQESGWQNVNNAGSGAAGIPQSLTHPQYGFPEFGGYGLTRAQVAAANAGHAAEQILWGLLYILATYQTPCGAWDHEQKHNWY